MAFQAITDPNDPRLKDTPLNPTDGGGECGSTGTTEEYIDYRPTGSQSNLTTNDEPITTTTESAVDCTKPDTPETIRLQQTLTLDSTDLTGGSMLKIFKSREYGEAASGFAKDLAERATGQGNSVFNSNYTPPSNNVITNIFGGPSNSKQLNDIQQTTSSMNNLVNFSSLSTPVLRQFIQMFGSIPGIQGLEDLPYFKPLSESIGSSITFLTDASGLKHDDWIVNAASGLNVTTPISKLNRSKIHPKVVESVDKVFKDLNQSVDLNLGQLFSQYAGFLSLFSNLLGFLPSQITNILGPILGVAKNLLGPLQTIGSGGGGGSNIVGQAAGFVNQIFSAYSQIARTAHGLDLIVDVVHHQRVLDKQSQMLSNLSSKFGDQLRVLNNHFPVKGGVKVGNSIQSSSIHGYSTTVNLLGDKIIYTHYTNDVLNALKAVV